ncbi:hypothetical protein ES703_65134 [subsurface metagenome]
MSISAVPSNSICYGDEITFIASSTNAGTNPVYQWKVNDLNVGANSSVFSSSSLADGDIVTCILTSSELCVTNNPVVDFIQVTVFPVPKIVVSADIIKGCEPLTVHFNEGSQNTGHTYFWDFGDNGVSTQRNPVHVYVAGSYDVSLTVTSDEGCRNSIVYDNMITVYPLPEANFYPDPSVTNIMKPVINFDNYSTGGYIDYCTFGDGETGMFQSGDDFIHTYQYPGFYDVLLITETNKGCRDSVKHKVVIKDVVTFYAPSAFSPDNNSMNDLFMVKGTGIDPDEFTMIIYDRWGEKVFETDVFNSVVNESEAWDGRIKDGRKAPAGTYTWLVVFSNIEGEKHKKVGAVTVIR